MENKQSIKQMVQLTKDLTARSGEKFVLRNIMSSEVEGEDTSCYLEILAERDLYKVKENSFTTGSITIEHIRR